MSIIMGIQTGTGRQYEKESFSEKITGKNIFAGTAYGLSAGGKSGHLDHFGSGDSLVSGFFLHGQRRERWRQV